MKGNPVNNINAVKLREEITVLKQKSEAYRDSVPAHESEVVDNRANKAYWQGSVENCAEVLSLIERMEKPDEKQTNSNRTRGWAMVSRGKIINTFVYGDAKAGAEQWAKLLNDDFGTELCVVLPCEVIIGEPFLSQIENDAESVKDANARIANVNERHIQPGHFSAVERLK